MSASTSSALERQVYVASVEATLQRIAGHRGVVGYLVLDPASGSVLRWVGFADKAKEAHRYAAALCDFVDLASSTVRTVDWSDRMTFLRLSCGSLDVLVAPDVNRKYTLVVVQRIV